MFIGRVACARQGQCQFLGFLDMNQACLSSLDFANGMPFFLQVAKAALIVFAINDSTSFDTANAGSHW